MMSIVFGNNSPQIIHTTVAFPCRFLNLDQTSSRNAQRSQTRTRTQLCHTQPRKRNQCLQTPPLLNPPHTLPLDIQPPHLPPPLPPQRPPHLLKLPLPKPQQPPRLHLDPLLEGELRLYGPELVRVAEDAELGTVVSGVAYDIVSAGADFVEEIGRVRREAADWRGGGVGAAYAD